MAVKTVCSYNAHENTVCESYRHAVFPLMFFYNDIILMSKFTTDLPLWTIFILSCFERSAAIALHRYYSGNRTIGEEENLDVQPPTFIRVIGTMAATMRNLMSLQIGGQTSVLAGNPRDLLCLVRSKVNQRTTIFEPDTLALVDQLLRIPRNAPRKAVHCLRLDRFAVWPLRLSD